MSLGLVVAALSSSVPVVDPSPKEESLVTCWSVMTTGKSKVNPLLEFPVLNLILVSNILSKGGFFGHLMVNDDNGKE